MFGTESNSRCPMERNCLQVICVTSYIFNCLVFSPVKAATGKADYP